MTTGRCFYKGGPPPAASAGTFGIFLTPALHSLTRSLPGPAFSCLSACSTGHLVPSPSPNVTVQLTCPPSEGDAQSSLPHADQQMTSAIQLHTHASCPKLSEPANVRGSTIMLESPMHPATCWYTSQGTQGWLERWSGHAHSSSMARCTVL